MKRESVYDARRGHRLHGGEVKFAVEFSALGLVLTPALANDVCLDEEKVIPAPVTNLMRHSRYVTAENRRRVEDGGCDFIDEQNTIAIGSTTPRAGWLAGWRSIQRFESNCTRAKRAGDRES